MIMALMVKATAYVVSSYECNTDSFEHMALCRAALFAKRDHWTNLPMVRSDNDLEPLEIDGEVVMKGKVSVSATVDDIEHAEKVLNEFIVAAMNFGFEVGFEIIGKILL